MAWTAAEHIGTQAIRFGLGIAVARKLMPEDYGAVGMLGIFMAIAQTLLDSGFANALIQKQDRTELDYSTTFYFNIVVGLVLYAILFLCAPVIARFYGLPILSPVTRVYALSVVFDSLVIVHMAKLSIDLNFKLQSLITIVTTIACGAMGVVLAYSGFGVWALVFQSLGVSVFRSVLLWGMTRWVPQWRFSWPSFRVLFAFGSKLLASSLINTVYNNIYTIVIGKRFPAAEVGYFNRGLQFATLPSDVLTSIVVKVNYPILASLQNESSRLLQAYNKLLRTPMYLLAPILVGMAALAEPMVAVILGQKWLPCVVFLQILCFGCLWNPLTHVNLNLLYVKGRSDLVLRLELIKKPVAFCMLLVTIPLGVKAMCVGRAAYDLIAFMFNCYYTKKILGYGLWQQLQAVLPIFLKAGLMGGCLLLACTFLQGNLLKLLLGVPLGAAVYLGIGWLTRDESLRDLLHAVRRSLRVE